MSAPPQTPFGLFLQQAPMAQDPRDLAAAWVDQTVTFRLSDAAGLNRTQLGSHLRRSFLGALGRDASPQARDGLPCPRDPPCALDVFRREQFRGDHGNGLPKPFVIFTRTEGVDLLVSLRVFGAANDWFATASQAFLAGMQDILPWQKTYRRPMPDVSSRQMEHIQGLPLPRVVDRVTLEFLAPVDTSGAKNGASIERSLLARLVRRINGLGCWQGLRLSPDCTQTLTAVIGGLDFSGSDLPAGTYVSANRAAENRIHRTVTGRLCIAGPIEPILPILAIGGRCHMGRAAREGLGRYRVLGIK